MSGLGSIGFTRSNQTPMLTKWWSKPLKHIESCTFFWLFCEHTQRNDNKITLESWSNKPVHYVRTSKETGNNHRFPSSVGKIKTWTFFFLTKWSLEEEYSHLSLMDTGGISLLCRGDDNGCPRLSLLEQCWAPGRRERPSCSQDLSVTLSGTYISYSSTQG